MVLMKMDGYVAYHRQKIEAYRQECRAVREDVLRRLEGVPEVCRRFETLTGVYVFGSVLTERFSANSDLDMAVCGADPRTYFKLWRALEEVVGRPVDLVDLDAQKPEFREAITSRGRLVYEKP